MPESETKRNILFHSGHIYTQDPGQPYCQAMVIANGRVQWLGNNDDLFAVPADSYAIADLGGRMVLPGFCDAHMHYVFWAQSRSCVNLDGCRSYREVLNKIGTYAAKLAKGEWLVGQGWQKDQWSRPIWPNRSDLDRVTGNRPAAIFSRDEHLLWVNSVALERGRITADTADPAGGEIARDSSGQPTGILKEKAASLIWRIVPNPSERRTLNALAQAEEECHALGITALSSFDTLDNFSLLQTYHQRRGCRLRIAYYVPAENSADLLRLKLKSGFGDERLWIQGVKIFADGALGSQTAYMFKPYKNHKSYRGISRMPAREMTELIGRCCRGSLNVAVHAIGDRANYQVIRALLKAVGKRAGRFRHRIEHCQVLRKEDLRAFGRYGIIASVQPCHLLSDLDLVAKYWGRRGRYAYAFRSILDGGGKLAFGSDAPIEPPAPLYNIYAAVSRKRLGDGRIFYPAEKVSVAAAIHAHTWGGAWAQEAEPRWGSIKVGNYADIVILENDLHKIRADEIPNVKIVATLFEGEIVYGKRLQDDWLEHK